ncbi:hypothetical protein BJ322DRAFT_1057261 [Thelephora terrestris]|uniref:Uncharacterized protein n=1 Tax=Thelephora terrestris TaxID=56493 RepID=A0A9P6HFK2_9AGAM|nr:hypothetical protein BJ322DRAFT_1057261 [Thelephora terrestris]
MMYSRPPVSSPLVIGASRSSVPPTLTAKPHFPTSRPLRPFASIPKPTSTQKKPCKLLECPNGLNQTVFVLNLSQAEFSRTD